MNAPADAVVVAISTGGYEAALQFAIAEARRTKRPLHLVHVLQLHAAEAYVGVYDAMLDDAKATLAEATARAQALSDGDLSVSSEVAQAGSIAANIVRAARGASLIVAQHRALSRVKRVVSGSVTLGVAARADVPVMSVPEAWSPSTEPTGIVTAAVQDPVEAPALLRAAFSEARDRGAELVVLHAWWLASGYDVVAVDDAFREERTTQLRAELDPVLAPLAQEFPEVKVTVNVRHAPPVEAVLDAAEASDLLVLGRRHHLLPLGSHLGPVTRAALDHATCPVLVTPGLGAGAARASTEGDATVRSAELASSAS
jgi:nucleotide-binding universal stress UspA family protein